MKKLICVVLLVFLALGAVFAHAESANNRLYQDLVNYIDSCEGRMSAMNWAFEYVKAYTESGTWEDLVRARAAASSAYRYLDQIPMPQMTTSPDESLALMDAGIEAEVVEEHYFSLIEDFDYDRVTYISLMSHLMDNAFLKDDFEFLKKWLDVEEKSLDAEGIYLWYMYNYLTEQIYPGIDGVSCVEQAKERWPFLSLYFGEWETDGEKIGELVGAKLDEYQKLEKDAVVLTEEQEYSVDVLEQMIENNDLEAIKAQLLTIAGEPARFPAAYYVNAETARYYYAYVDQETFETRLVTCFDDLSVTPSSLMIRCDSVSVDEFVYYLLLLDKFGIYHQDTFGETDADIDYSGIAVSGESFLSITWDDEAIQFFFPEPAGSMVPELYILAQMNG